MLLLAFLAALFSVAFLFATPKKMKFHLFQFIAAALALTSVALFVASGNPLFIFFLLFLLISTFASMAYIARSIIDREEDRLSHKKTLSETDAKEVINASLIQSMLPNKNVSLSILVITTLLWAGFLAYGIKHNHEMNKDEPRGNTAALFIGDQVLFRKR